MNGTKELVSQKLDSVLYVAVHLQPLAVQVIWLKKTECIYMTTDPIKLSEFCATVNTTNVIFGDCSMSTIRPSKQFTLAMTTDTTVTFLLLQWQMLMDIAVHVPLSLSH